MASEILCFDRWLQRVQQRTRPLAFVPALDAVARAAAEAFGARFWFVEILGKRWSYLAGHVCDAPDPGAIFRVPLNSGIGLVGDTWGCLSDDERAQLIALLNRLIARRAGP